MTNYFYFAVIMHEFGSTGFLDKTEEGLYRQLADWCMTSDIRVADALSYREIVDLYFEEHNDELCFIHCERLEDALNTMPYERKE